MGLSMSTRLENRHTEPIVVQANKNGFLIDEFNVTIQPGASVHVYYSDLGINYNYSQPYIRAFTEGQENQGQTLLTSAVRNSEVIVFGFENGVVTVKPFKGKFLPRIGFLRCVASPTLVPDDQPSLQGKMASSRLNSG